MTDVLARLTQRLDNTARALELNGSAGARLQQIAGPALQREAAVATSKFNSAGEIIPGTGRADVRVDGTPTPTGYQIRLQLTPALTWILGEVGIDEHDIAPLQGTSGRSRVVGGRGFKHPVSHAVHHPGVPGGNAIRYAVKRVREAQGRAVDDGINSVLQEAWNRG